MARGELPRGLRAVVRLNDGRDVEGAVDGYVTGIGMGDSMLILRTDDGLLKRIPLGAIEQPVRLTRDSEEH